MAVRPKGDLSRRLGVLFRAGAFGTLTDGQLLERFRDGSGEVAELAFAVLVERHGPSVLGTCRAVLRDEHAAQDAFQATFLVLVGKVRRLWVRESLGPWLREVAYRVASGARVSAARRRRHERCYAERVREACHEPVAHDATLYASIRSEVERLPADYRAAVRLCDMEGHTHEAAARRLGWPLGTVKTRLTRGRRRLRRQLARRGLAPAAVPTSLAAATARAAARLAAGGAPAPAISSLTKGVLSAMFMSKIKVALVAALATGVLSAGAVVLAQQTRPGVSAGDEAAGIGERDAVAQEMDRLDREVSAEEMGRLRERVESALRRKLRIERARHADTDEVRAARDDYEKLRRAYLAAARARSRPEAREETLRVEPEPAAKPTAAGANVASAIGSIDIDAIFRHYNKAAVLRKQIEADATDRKVVLGKLMSEVQHAAQELEKFPTGSPDVKGRDANLAMLRDKIEADRAQAQREFAQREAKALASLYREVQDAIASVAREKGLIYVVKISREPPIDADATALMAALNRSIAYADPQTDITEEVLRVLNRGEWKKQEDQPAKP